MATWIDGNALMKYWDLWTWTDKKGMPHEFAYIPAPVVTRAIEAAKNSGVEMKPVVHAHWISDDDGWDNPYWLCSHCGEAWWFEDGTPEDNKMNYCPLCGAKMDNGMVLDCET